VRLTFGSGIDVGEYVFGGVSVNTVSEAMLLAWRCLLCTSRRESGDKYSDERSGDYHMWQSERIETHLRLLAGGSGGYRACRVGKA